MTDDARWLQTVLACELAHAPDVEAIRRCEEQAEIPRAAAAAARAAAEAAAEAQRNAAVLARSPAVAYDSPQRLYGWFVSCRIDRMDDHRSCYAAKGDLRVHLTQGGKTFVVIPRTETDRYPGSRIFVRLDTQSALSTDAEAWEGAAARDIVARMCRAEWIATRYIDWPWKTYVDDEFSPRGFCDVWDYLQKAVHTR